MDLIGLTFQALIRSAFGQFDSIVLAHGSVKGASWKSSEKFFVISQLSFLSLYNIEAIKRLDYNDCTCSTSTTIASISDRGLG